MKQEGYNPLQNIPQENYQSAKAIHLEQAGNLLSTLTSNEKDVLDIDLNNKGSGLDFFSSFERPEDLGQLLTEWQAAYRSGNERERLVIRTRIVDKLQD